MKKTFAMLVLTYLLFGNTILAQQKLNDIQISVLTEAPGDRLYSVFGHSALRIKDETIGLDIVFNYGMFSFNAPNFYLNFIQGHMNYWLGTETYGDFFITYASENRGIHEQVLEMDSIQKQFVIDFLEDNLKTENRYYLYHFFDDNCATRIRDLVSLTYNGAVLPTFKAEISYRELVHQYLTDRPWSMLGIDILLGLSADKKTNASDQMFLPDYLFNTLDNTKYKGREIVKETKVVFVPEEVLKSSSLTINPQIFFCGVFFLALLFCFIKKGAKVFDFVLFTIVGIVGTIIFSLWLFTNHVDVRNNLNIIWAIPTHLIMAFFMLSDKHSSFYQKYFFTTFILSVLLLITWILIPQELNVALIPLVASISLRSLYNSFSNTISINKFTKLFNFNN